MAKKIYINTYTHIIIHNIKGKVKIMTVIFQYFTVNCIFIATLLWSKKDCSIHKIIFMFWVIYRDEKKV